jgi:heme exporter protein A
MASSKQLFSGIDITCMRGGRILFQKLSFGINPGDIVHLSGPNGAGKTSLLRIMCGALPVTDGEVLWNGKSFLENGMTTHSERYAFLPADDRSLKPLETVLENIRFWAGLWGVANDACSGALDKMQLLGLKNVPVRHLSTGQKRRLSLARVFVKTAPLWLLDEPLSGLDRDSYDLLMKALNVHCANGGMVAVASHYTIEPPKYGRLVRVDVGVKS